MQGARDDSLLKKGNVEYYYWGYQTEHWPANVTFLTLFFRPILFKYNSVLSLNASLIDKARQAPIAAHYRSLNVEAKNFAVS